MASITGIGDQKNLDWAKENQNSSKYLLEQIKVCLANNDLKGASELYDKLDLKKLNGEDVQLAKKFKQQILQRYSGFSVNTYQTNVDSKYYVWKPQRIDVDGNSRTTDNWDKDKYVDGKPVFDYTPESFNKKQYGIDINSNLYGIGVLDARTSLGVITSEHKKIDFPYYVYDNGQTTLAPEERALDGTIHDAATFSSLPYLSLTQSIGIPWHNVVNSSNPIISMLMPAILNRWDITVKDTVYVDTVHTITGYNFNNTSKSLVSNPAIDNTLYRDKLELSLWNSTRDFTFSDYPNVFSVGFKGGVTGSWLFLSDPDAIYFIDKNYQADTWFKDIKLTDAQRSQLITDRQSILDQRSVKKGLSAYKVDVQGTVKIPGLYGLLNYAGAVDSDVVTADEPIQMVAKGTWRINDQLRATDDGFYPSSLYLFPNYSVSRTGTTTTAYNKETDGYFMRLPGENSFSYDIELSYKPRLGYIGKAKTIFAPENDYWKDWNIVNAIPRIAALPLQLLAIPDYILFRHMDSGQNDNFKVLLPVTVGFGQEKYGVLDVNTGKISDKVDKNFRWSVGVEVVTNKLDLSINYMQARTGESSQNGFSAMLRF
jgi:hypothetical protein